MFFFDFSVFDSIQISVFSGKLPFHQLLLKNVTAIPNICYSKQSLEEIELLYFMDSKMHIFFFLHFNMSESEIKLTVKVVV